jgi:hypothetical protein
VQTTGKGSGETVDANRPKGNSGPRTVGRGAIFLEQRKECTEKILIWKKKEEVQSLHLRHFCKTQWIKQREEGVKNIKNPWK